MAKSAAADLLAVAGVAMPAALWCRLEARSTREESPGSS